MVERVERPLRKDEVPSRIDIVENFPRYEGKILEAYIVIENNNELCIHHLSHSPKEIHHLARVAGKALFNGDDDAVVKYAFKRHAEVGYFRAKLPQEGKKKPFRRFRHITVFFGGNPDNGCRKDRIFTPRDPFQMEYGVQVGEGIKTCVVSKRAFEAGFLGIDITFENEFGVCGNQDI